IFIRVPEVKPETISPFVRKLFFKSSSDTDEAKVKNNDMMPFPPSKNSARKRQFSVNKFASKKQVLPPFVISSSYTKIRCRTKPFFRSLPEPKVIFFHWQGIETKINLVAPRRQTVLRNSPTDQQPLAHAPKTCR
ncbi:hypothetical protein AVEN_55644-1, partial [Araneus ventricosus]